MIFLQVVFFVHKVRPDNGVKFCAVVTDFSISADVSYCSPMHNGIAIDTR